MKYQTTKKAVEGFYNCLSVGYCRLQYLLHFEEPESYTVRREGWAADVYNVGAGYAVITGYSPFGKAISYDMCKKYDERARRILYNDKRYKKEESKEKALQKLLIAFRREATES